MSDISSPLLLSVYFAPRGEERLIQLGMDIAMRHLSPTDKIIGLVGDIHSGKTALVKGIFPGLELADSSGQELPDFYMNGTRFFNRRTVHIHISSKYSPEQLSLIASQVMDAIDADKRLVIENFNRLYPYLDLNAQLLLGVGGEILVTRPTIFGPEPENVAKSVYRTMIYRKMAHTAEHLTDLVIERDYGFKRDAMHSDVRHGFVLEFDQLPPVELADVESRVQALIDKDLPVKYVDPRHIMIGDILQPCKGPWFHVQSTAQIEAFRLLPDIYRHPKNKRYMLVGVVADTHDDGYTGLNKIVY